MADRASYKTFCPGDQVTVRRVVKSSRYQDACLRPGMVGTVVAMEQRVLVDFGVQFSYGGLWRLYDGDLILVSPRS